MDSQIMPHTKHETPTSSKQEVTSDIYPKTRYFHFFYHDCPGSPECDCLTGSHKYDENKEHDEDKEHDSDDCCTHYYRSYQIKNQEEEKKWTKAFDQIKDDSDPIWSEMGEMWVIGSTCLTKEKIPYDIRRMGCIEETTLIDLKMLHECNECCSDLWQNYEEDFPFYLFCRCYRYKTDSKNKVTPTVDPNINSGAIDVAYYPDSSTPSDMYRTSRDDLFMEQEGIIIFKKYNQSPVAIGSDIQNDHTIKKLSSSQKEYCDGKDLSINENWRAGIMTSIHWQTYIEMSSSKE